MKLLVDMKSDAVKLSLVAGGKIVDELTWAENNSLSRLLLAKIDLILRKNKTGLDKISEFEIISEVPKKWTSYRIAEITLKSLMLARTSPR